jgi:hypothetical protein
LSRQHPTFQEPDIRIDDAAFHSWKHGQLANAEATLTATIHESRNPSHHALAGRALVRVCLRQRDAAIADATEVVIALLSHALTLIYIKSIKFEPSVIDYIAKSVALVVKWKKLKAYRRCDIAFVRFHSTYPTFLLLIKVCIPCNLAALGFSDSLGYRRVYGLRAWRRDIPRRRFHRFGAIGVIGINMPRGSGTCTMRYHTTNISVRRTSIPLCRPHCFRPCLEQRARSRSAP